MPSDIAPPPATTNPVEDKLAAPSAEAAPALPIQASVVPEAINATSEANIAATNSNTTSLPTHEPPKNDADVDTLAADNNAEGATSGAAVVAPGSSATPGSTTKKGKDSKRRSSVLPEHKSRKGGNKKKDVILNLDCQPGDFYFARMKGHPEWPSIIADEEMLPEPIIGSRPVTARRVDYTYRDDYANGGKNAALRTYPVMFLGTNEFAWMVNSDLRKLNPEDIEDLSNIKITKKGLAQAYEVAKARRDLDYFKDIIFNHEKARAEEERAFAEEQAAAAAKAAKAETDGDAEEAPKSSKKAKRKSTVPVSDGDEMDVDQAVPEAAKSTKKRKKSNIEPDTEEKPSKTPKIKLNATKIASAADSASKSKPKVKTPKAKAVIEEQPQILSEADQKEKTQKSVLYLRHKLQKGFLQDQAPKESEMAAMAGHFDTLQQWKILEVEIIRATKIHKVLKAILKLDTVPLDDKYNFKKQSNELLSGWNKILAENSGPTAPNGTTNGAKHEDIVQTVEGSAAPLAKEEQKADAIPAKNEESKIEASADGDVSMAEASKTEAPTTAA